MNKKFSDYLKEAEQIQEVSKANDLEKSVVDFIVENPDVKDVDEIATSLELDEEKVEAIVLKLVVDFFTGGKSKGKDVEVDADELAKGMKVESEHSSNPLIQRKIINDHEIEAPGVYYKDLEQMEKKEEAEEKTSDVDEAYINGYRDDRNGNPFHKLLGLLSKIETQKQLDIFYAELRNSKEYNLLTDDEQDLLIKNIQVKEEKIQKGIYKD